MNRKGFTLIELLVTTTIIGVLASIGTVSYSFVRVKARDVKRASDIQTIWTAIELYYDRHSEYPPSPPDGIVLGGPDAQVISDAGITAEGEQRGAVYLRNVPANVLPNGVPYLYRSLSDGDARCTENCHAYELYFALEGGAGSFRAGPHRYTEAGLEGPETDTDVQTGFLAAYAPRFEEIQAAFGDAAELAELAREEIADRPEVQTANQAVVAPVAAVAAVTNLVAVVAAAAPVASVGQVAFLLLLHPLQRLRRRKSGWGTVYDAGKKTPLDLASVRLVDARSGRPVASKVTDENGRYAFSPKAGTYRIEVSKPGYLAPAPSMAGQSEDGPYHDLYHGTLFDVAVDGQTVAFDVPVEHEAAPPEDVRKLLSERNKRAFRKAVALSGPFLGLVALVITPGAPMLLLFLVQLAVYTAFKRVAEPSAPKSHGIIYDEETKDPVPRAVVRILSLPYHKVLETKLTDAAGRYSFHVGHGKYYLVVTKPGYGKTETDEIDFSGIGKPTFIASDLPMRKSEG